jgi:hypothetical protein
MALLLGKRPADGKSAATTLLVPLAIVSGRTGESSAIAEFTAGRDTTTGLIAKSRIFAACQSAGR